MKSLMFLMCCLGVLAQLRATHALLPSEGAHVTHLPDESNFQASGGAALGSFGGFTRVIVLLVVILGVIYHGFVPAAIFGPEARPAPALPVRKLSGPSDDSLPVLVRTATTQVLETSQAPTELRAEVTQKISKQAAKKLAKKTAKKLVEAVHAVEEKKTPVVEEKKAPVVETVVVEKKKKNRVKPVVVAPAVVVVREEKDQNVAVVAETVVENFAAVGEDNISQAKEKVEVEEEVVQFAKEEKVIVKEEERQEEVSAKKSGWVMNPPRVFERTSVTIKKAKQLLNVAPLAGDDLDLNSFVVDPRAVNCPAFLTGLGPLLLEESSPLDTAEQDTPASIEPVRDKAVAPFAEFVPRNNISAPTPLKIEVSGDWAFNSHKKTAWMQKQSRSALADVPDFMTFGQMPWSPIRTPCKFAAACKKPGCQFTHPNTIPAWLPTPVF